MKNLLRIMILFIVVSMCLPFLLVSAASDNSGKLDFRGVWVATVANIDYPSKPTTDTAALKSEAVKILDNAKNMGLNAVFLQVRPAADALYKSKN